MKKKLKVQGLEIRLEPINETDYVSLTDIAKQSENQEPNYVIANWMKNRNTLEFLEVWESLKNPNFKPNQMIGFKEKYLSNRNAITPKRWITELNAIGIISKSGRNGGTFAHKDIALNFCYWLSPTFQVYMITEFQRLKEIEYEQKNLKWHISKITDNVEELRNLLDTIPYQDTNRNRLKGNEE